MGPFLGLVLGPVLGGWGRGAFLSARRARARRGGPGPAPQYRIQGVCAIPPLGGGFSQNPHPTPPPPPCSEESGNPRGQRQIPPSARTELEARPPPPLGPLQPPLGCLCVLHEFEVMARRTLGRQRRGGRGGGSRCVALCARGIGRPCSLWCPCATHTLADPSSPENVMA